MSPHKRVSRLFEVRFGHDYKNPLSEFNVLSFRVSLNELCDYGKYFRSEVIVGALGVYMFITWNRYK